jgi:5-formyltetrahydrofolate cyclo-ligase
MSFQGPPHRKSGWPPPTGHGPTEPHGVIPSSAEEMLRERVKAELRKRMRGLRGALPKAARAERSKRIVERLLACEPMVGARSIGLFWPMEHQHEVDLRPIVPSLRAAGARIALPAMDSALPPFALRFVNEETPLEQNALGFCAPGPECPLATEVDVVVVPALAIDLRGHRLGYGAGYYDRLLPGIAPPAVAVAVAFDVQLVAEIPEMPWDVAVSWLVTDARCVRCETS